MNKKETILNKIKLWSVFAICDCIQPVSMNISLLTTVLEQNE